MTQTYLFYDIETSGLNKAFDQILQFAAIRTDLAFNEIERHELEVRLSPDVVPSPAAVLTHQITPDEMAKGIPEIEAIAKIHALFNMPGTISLGYNTLGFDDEFLRFSFYRNLLPPYTHQYANQCTRCDVYPIVVLYFLYKPEVLQWLKIEGKVSLKLADLCTANQLAKGMAHNAMVDVTAVTALSRKLQQAPDVWRYAATFFNKVTADERFKKLPIAFTCKQQNFREGLLLKGEIGFENAYQCPVLAIGNHRHYKNQTLWLRLDGEKLNQTTSETIAENSWAYALKSGEANFILPLTAKYTQHLNPQRQYLVEQNKAWLLSHPDLFYEIIEYHQEYTYPKIPNIDIDAALYQNGFLSAEQQALCTQFHKTPWPEKAACIEKFNPALREQAIRLIGRNYLQHLPQSYKAEFAEYLRQIAPEKEDDALIDYRGQRRLTPQRALAEIEVLKRQTGLNDKQINLLDSLENYLREKFLL